MTVLEIESAFEGVSHPANYNLLGVGCSDDNDIKFLYKYQHRHWADVDFGELSYDWECIFFLSNKGFAFVVPSFMKMVLDDHESIPEWIEPLCEIIQKRKSYFNQEQQELLDQFLSLDFSEYL